MGFDMDIEAALRLLLSLAEQNGIWLLAAFLLGLIAGWMSYSRGPGKRPAVR